MTTWSPLKVGEVLLVSCVFQLLRFQKLPMWSLTRIDLPRILSTRPYQDGEQHFSVGSMHVVHPQRCATPIWDDPPLRVINTRVVGWYGEPWSVGKESHGRAEGGRRRDGHKGRVFRAMLSPKLPQFCSLSLFWTVESAINPNDDCFALGLNITSWQKLRHPLPFQILNARCLPTRRTQQ